MSETQQFGNTGRVQTGIEYTYNLDKDTGNGFTLTYEIPEGQARGSLPALGSTTSHMAGVVLTKATVKPGEAGIATVTLEYSKPREDDEDEDEEEEDEGSSGGGSDDTEEEEEEVEEWSLDGSVNDEPLLAHPKAQAQMTDDQREYLKAVIDGTRMWERVAVLNQDGSPKLDKDGQQVMAPLKQVLKSSLSANGKAILQMIMSGIHSYRSPAATFREISVVRASQVSLNGLGKIGSPKGAPSTGNRNWLLVGCNFSRTSQDKRGKWRLERLYELSAEGGWNKDLYS